MKCGFNPFTISFNHKPIPKARPRARRTGAFVRIYQPISDFEKGLELFCKYKKTIPKGIKCAIKCELYFRFLRPSGVPKWKIFKASKPDADNLAKGAKDALTKAGVWFDDSQVSILIVDKVYTDDKDREGVLIKISHLECKTRAGCK